MNATQRQAQRRHHTVRIVRHALDLQARYQRINARIQAMRAEEEQILAELVARQAASDAEYAAYLEEMRRPWGNE